MKKTGSHSTLGMEILVGNILKAGFLFSAFVVLLGGVCYLWAHGLSTPEYSAFHGEPSRLKGVSEILQTALTLRPRSIIQLGLLFLIATPVIRVFCSCFMYAKQKDWLYTSITLLVFLLLIFSLTCQK